VPWGWGQIDWSLEMVLGSGPAAKVLHGSDESFEPKMFPVSARLVRQALRVGAPERSSTGTTSPSPMPSRSAKGVLADNVRRLHGI